ncbi:MAG: PEGA domain-containing protein [Sandaracinaceae bacterium]|nr:PEGA domain-containing protein [Sandaracinaceae bacterium]
MTRFAIVFAALTLFTFGAHAQDDREQARAQFERGVGLYEAQDYAGALAAFQEAYRIAPHPTVRVNMANCYEHLNRPIEAIHHFERFLAESPGAPRPQRREVEGAVARLRGTVGEIRLAVTPDGARITIDEQETRIAPVLEPILMMVGTHSVVVAMDGYRTSRETIEVRAGDTQRVAIRLERGVDAPAVAAVEPVREPIASASEAPAAAEDPDEPEAFADGSGGAPAEDGGGGFTPRLTLPVVIFAAAAVGLGIGAIVTGSLAVAENDRFEEAVVRSNTAPTGAERRQARMDGESAADAANALSIVTDVLLIGTIAAAGAAAFFFIIDGLNDDAESIVGREGGVLAAPTVSPQGDGGGVALIGWF